MYDTVDFHKSTAMDILEIEKGINGLALGKDRIPEVRL
jgi:hypothetical protein